jgi:hypothetical protein
MLDRPTALKAMDFLVARLQPNAESDIDLLGNCGGFKKGQSNSVPQSIDLLNLPISTQVIKAAARSSKNCMGNVKRAERSSENQFLPRLFVDNQPSFCQTFVQNIRINPMTMTRLTPFHLNKTSEFNDLKAKEHLRKKSLKPISTGQALLLRERKNFSPQTDLLGECISNLKIDLISSKKDQDTSTKGSRNPKKIENTLKTPVENGQVLERIINSIFLKTPSKLVLTINRLPSPEPVTKVTSQAFLKEILDPNLTLRGITNPLFPKLKARIIALMPEFGTEKDWDRLESHVKGCIAVFLKEHRDCGATCNHVTSFSDSLKILVHELSVGKFWKSSAAHNF